jgi:hypothetical protein
MKTHPIEAAAIAAVAVVRLVRTVAVPVVALALTMAGCRSTAATPAAPAAPAAVPVLVAAPVVRDWACRPLDALTVRELRLQARAVGLRALARNGRRADLLAALALA